MNRNRTTDVSQIHIPNAPHTFAIQFLRWDILRIVITFQRNRAEPTHRIGQLAIDLHLADTFIAGIVLTSHVLNYSLANHARSFYIAHIRGPLLFIIVITYRLLDLIYGYVLYEFGTPIHTVREVPVRPVPPPTRRTSTNDRHAQQRPEAPPHQTRGRRQPLHQRQHHHARQENRERSASETTRVD